VSICVEDHINHLPAEFNKLPESQAARWRHRCAACAYDLGRRHSEEVEERLRGRVRELSARVAELKEGRGER
jgi:uncharacterized protein with PIN domain